MDFQQVGLHIDLNVVVSRFNITKHFVVIKTTSTIEERCHAPDL